MLGQVKPLDAYCTGMEELGIWHRIDPKVTPTKFHAAVCSTREREMLARIKRVVRKGHVTALTPEEMLLEDGTEQMPPDTLYIDCTASAGVVMTCKVPRVFSGNEININLIRPFQPLFGAALIAFLEAHVPDENLRAACTNTVNFHDTPAQYVAQMLPAMMNQGAWSKVPEVKEWIGRTRLQALNHLLPGYDAENPEHASIMSRFGPAARAALQNIPYLK